MVYPRKKEKGRAIKKMGEETQKVGFGEEEKKT